MISNTFGIYLEQLRGNRSLRDISKKINISHTYIRYLELGQKTDPSPETLRKISNFYQVSYLELMIKVGYVNHDDIHNYISNKEDEE